MDKDMQKMALFLNALSGRSTDDWANEVERNGQSQVVNAEMLPKDMGKHFDRPADCATPREVYERMGIVFGEDADEIFIKATLPAGWKKVRTDHYMWSKVVDEKGRERISIFYKPEFYDRSAHMSPCRRFSIGSTYSDNGKSQTVFVRDGEENIHTIGSVTRHGDDHSAWLAYDAEQQKLYADAKAWLNEHYPEWENILAYWD